MDLILVNRYGADSFSISGLERHELPEYLDLADGS